MLSSIHDLASLDDGLAEHVIEALDELVLEGLEQSLTDLWPHLEYRVDLGLGNTKDPYSQFVNRVSDPELWPAACVLIGQKWLLSRDEHFSDEVEQLVDDCRMKAMWVVDSSFADQVLALKSDLASLERGRINPADVMLIEAGLFRPQYLQRLGRELIRERRFTEAFFRFVTAGEVALREWGWIRAFGLEPPHRFNNVKSKFAKRASACGYGVEDLDGWEGFCEIYDLRSTQVFHGQREVTSIEATEAEECLGVLLRSLPAWLDQEPAGFAIDALSDHVVWRNLSGLLRDHLQEDLGYALRRVRDMAHEIYVERIASSDDIVGIDGWRDLAYGLPPAMDEYLEAGEADMARFLLQDAQAEISAAFDSSSLLLEALGRSVE